MALGLEIKELFVLAEIDEHPHPAELAVKLSMPKPSVTVNLKRLEAAGFVRREIDTTDLRRHRRRTTRRALCHHPRDAQQMRRQRSIRIDPHFIGFGHQRMRANPMP